jgi:hypothetical protein
VLDTKGINIWCAAGKGSFGTAELVKRLAQVRLSETVTHRTLIVPQLGAPGVAAHQVFELSGFRVVYGPVRAADIPTYLRSGQKATPAMRQVHFTMLDRLVLTPVELVSGLKPALALLAVMLVINLALGKGASLAMLAKHTLMDFLPYFGAMVIGTVVFPLLLPYLPGRAFAAKGWFLGVVGVLIFIWATGSSASWTQVVEYLLLLPPIVSYLALNFTGCSTYTSFSGVAKEMKYAIPVQVISILAGIVLMLSTLFINP